MKIEVDKMKNIIFLNLWEHNTWYKVKSIHLQNKWFKKVYMNKYGTIMKKNPKIRWF